MAKEFEIIDGAVTSILNVTEVSGLAWLNLSVALANTEFGPLLNIVGSMLMLAFAVQLFELLGTRLTL